MDTTRPKDGADAPRVVKSDAEWRAELTPAQYHVTRQAGTERPGTGPWLHEKRAGTYACVACGQPLFRSETKYESGSGWPSFYQPIADGAVEEITDASHGMSARRSAAPPANPISATSSRMDRGRPGCATA